MAISKTEIALDKWCISGQGIDVVTVLTDIIILGGVFGGLDVDVDVDCKSVYG